jgi:hypothetical protein
MAKNPTSLHKEWTFRQDRLLTIEVKYSVSFKLFVVKFYLVRVVAIINRDLVLMGVKFLRDRC